MSAKFQIGDEGSSAGDPAADGNDIHFLQAADYDVYRPHPLWYPALLIALVFAMSLISATSVSFLLVGTVLSVALFVLVTVEALAWRARRAERANLLIAPLDTCTQVAEACIKRAYVSGRFGSRFDADHYLRNVPPTAPRVISLGVRLPVVPRVAEAHEELDVVNHRPIGKQERRLIYSGMLYSLVTGALWWTYGPMAGALAILVFVALMISWLRDLYRLGVRPFSVQSCLVAPGRVTCAGLFAPRGEFNRQNSVLVLSLKSDPQGIDARLTRADGTVARFTFWSGPGDPGLAELVARWSYPALRQAHGLSASDSGGQPANQALDESMRAPLGPASSQQ